MPAPQWRAAPADLRKRMDPATSCLAPRPSAFIDMRPSVASQRPDTLRLIFTSAALALVLGFLLGACVRKPPVSPVEAAGGGVEPEAVESSRVVDSDRDNIDRNPAVVPRKPVPPTNSNPPSAGVEKSPVAASPTPDTKPPATEVVPLHIPSTVRVGLATDLSELTLPCCTDSLLLQVDDSKSALQISSGSPATRVVPAAREVRRGIFRVQVAALKDELQAKGLAERIGKSIGQSGNAVFDAGSDLYRVRVGTYATREAAEAGRRQLEAAGMTDTWIAEEGAGLVDPGFDLVQGGRTRRLSGRWLSVRSASEQFVFDGKSFRGEMVIFINSRGSFNVINRLPLDNYLRGVIPKEMGPGQYPHLEALKAQAIAARTYTLRHLGEFSEEGYDICATPRCQVYGGRSAEHPLSDRAIRETADQVLVFHGALVDSLYSASCGGHTENVEAVFPLKSEQYLEGIACAERGGTRLNGVSTFSEVEEALLVRLLPAGTAEQLAARMVALADLVGLRVPDRGLSERPGEIKNVGDLRRVMIRLYDLKLDPRLLAISSKENQVMASDWGPSARELARELSSGDHQPISIPGQRLVLLLADELGLIDRYRAHFLDASQKSLVKLRVAGRQQVLPLAEFPVTGTMTSAVGEPARTRPLDLYPGDRIEVWALRGEVVALLGVDRGLTAPALSPRRWTRFRSDGQARGMVASRYPGFDYRSLEVLELGVSGRVARLGLVDGAGERLVIEGLAIRWTFDLLDTYFTVERHTTSEGVKGWLFRGRGHGHGVGMCQLGAVAMAERGLDHRQILGHYYTGVRLGRLPELPARKLARVVP